MQVLLLAFLVGIVLLFLLYKKKIPDISVSLPLKTATPTPTIFFAKPTPTNIPKFSELENDFFMIEKDIENLEKEDSRLTPPNFIFDLGLK